MGSYSSAVIGILLLALIITMGLSVLGVGINAPDGIQENDSEMPYIPEKKPLTEIISQEIPPEVKTSEDQSIEVNSIVSDGAYLGLCDVSVHQSYSFGPLDTVRGTLTIEDEVLPNLADPLPLCISDLDLSAYYVIVRSYGGYDPVRGGFMVNQLKDNVIEGCIYLEFENVNDQYKTAEDCCAVDYWKITFHTDKDICLDSNYTPFGFEDKKLDKDVWICGGMTWTGCDSPDQEFGVILAHKAMSQNPKLPIIKHRQFKVNS